MSIRIVFYVGEKKERELELTGGKMVIGRGTDCNLIINDPMVSSRHLTIFEQEGKPYVQDENSVNGTFLNGEPLSSAVLLGNKSEISFCNYKIVVYTDTAGTDFARNKVEEVGGNKTMMVSREDLNAARGGKLPFTKRQILIGSVAIGLVLILLILALLPSGNAGKKGQAPLRAGMLNTYFLKLEQQVRNKIDDKKNLAQGQSYYNLGTEKLKMAKVNYDAAFTALLYFYRAKGSIMGIEPKPALWDELNPKIAQTEQQLKKKLKQLFQQAWMAESENDNESAIQFYQTIEAMVPDESSMIYRTAAFRMAKLK
ncbi:MAG: FHA domain-containing protein [Acidobacteria bacterium]|nr:FHA domain-containing protein [Acidobacteriota bacterium]